MIQAILERLILAEARQQIQNSDRTPQEKRRMLTIIKELRR